MEARALRRLLLLAQVALDLGPHLLLGASAELAAGPLEQRVDLVLAALADLVVDLALHEGLGREAALLGFLLDQLLQDEVIEDLLPDLVLLLPDGGQPAARALVELGAADVDTVDGGDDLVGARGGGVR